MANSIALFKQYVPLLDEVYKEASKTAVLDGNPELALGGRQRKRTHHPHAGHAGPWGLQPQ